MNTRLYLLSLVALAAACSDVNDNTGGDNEPEVITTVGLTFTPQGGGAALDFKWTDPESDGSPVIDDIVLSDAEDYDVAVTFLNELADPAEDLTVEVRDESDQHQVFFTGSAVEGPATGDNADAVVTHAYADTDVNGLPVGLESTFATDAVGSGSLIVSLRHLPLESGQAVKAEGLAEDVAAGGFSAIGGDNDAQVTFTLDVE